LPTRSIPQREKPIPKVSRLPPAGVERLRSIPRQMAAKLLKISRKLMARRHRFCPLSRCEKFLMGKVVTFF
jgi:hypothetical protein